MAPTPTSTTITYSGKEFVRMPEMKIVISGGLVMHDLTISNENTYPSILFIDVPKKERPILPISRENRCIELGKKKQNEAGKKTLHLCFNTALTLPDHTFDIDLKTDPDHSHGSLRVVFTIPKDRSSSPESRKDVSNKNKKKKAKKE